MSQREEFLLEELRAAIGHIAHLRLLYSLATEHLRPVPDDRYLTLLMTEGFIQKHLDLGTMGQLDSEPAEDLPEKQSVTKVDTESPDSDSTFSCVEEHGLAFFHVEPRTPASPGHFKVTGYDSFEGVEDAVWTYCEWPTLAEAIKCADFHGGSMNVTYVINEFGRSVYTAGTY